MSNRKIPFSFFVLGVVQCLIRYFLIGIVGLACLFIGLINQSAAVQLGIIILLFWFFLSIIDEIKICHTIKENSSNAEVNEIFDKLFGKEEKMKKLLEERKGISGNTMKKNENYDKGEDEHEK